MRASFRADRGEPVPTIELIDDDLWTLRFGTPETSSAAIYLTELADAGDLGAWLRGLAARALVAAREYEATLPGAAAVDDDDVSPVGMVEAYSCGKCGSRFGVAGTHRGTVDDDQAEYEFAASVRRHESGACITDPATVEQVPA